MRTKTFAAFVAPSVFLMLFFISIPLITVVYQSLFVTKPVYSEVEVKTCSPSLFSAQCKTSLVSKPILDESGNPVLETAFIGINSYKEILQLDKVFSFISDPGKSLTNIFNIDFYKALRFTLTFTFITLPLVIIVGLSLAMAVQNCINWLRGPVIFASLLPFIITPVIGALSIRWLFVSDGIMSRFFEYLLDSEIEFFSQSWTIEILMMFYRVWHVAPFAFIIFFAALQTVNQDTLDASIVDGASRFERLRYVIIPHLMPLIIFVSMIHLMDSYRVFEEVIGFSSQAHVISLQWMTFDLLTPDNSGNRSISRASASSMLTMFGIILLLIPVVHRTWRDYKRN